MGDSPSQSLFASCSFYHYYPCVFTHLSTLMALAARSIKRSFNDSSLRRKYIGHLDVWGLCTKTFRSTACSELLIKCILRISFSLFTCLIHRNTLDRCFNPNFAFRQWTTPEAIMGNYIYSWSQLYAIVRSTFFVMVPLRSIRTNREDLPTRTKIWFAHNTPSWQNHQRFHTTWQRLCSLWQRMLSFLLWSYQPRSYNQSITQNLFEGTWSDCWMTLVMKLTFF